MTDIEKVSGKDNAEQGERSRAILTKLKRILGLHSLSSGRKQWSSLHHFPPTQAPEAAVVESSSPHPPHHKLQHIFHRSPKHVPESMKRATWKTHKKMVIAISVSVLAMLIVFGVMVVLFFACRRRRKSHGVWDSSKKVSFVTEPEMFYFNSLAPILESGSVHKLSFESERSASAESSLLDESHSEEGVVCSSSDGNESFHSVICCHYSAESMHCSPTSPPVNCSTMAERSRSENKPNIEECTEASKDAGSLTKVQILRSVRRQILKGSSAGNESFGNPPPPPPPPPPRRPFQNLRPTLRQQKKEAEVDEGGSPLPRLKPLHWDKVSAVAERSMVWDKIRSSSFVLDEKTIESLFGYNIHCSTRNHEQKSKNPSPNKQVLEHKRLQNFTILLKPLNATAEQVCSALMQGGGLSIQQLETLAKMVPTKDEEERLNKYEGDLNELGSTEKFMKAVLSIPLAFSRLGVMLFQETFEDEVVHLKKSFAILEEACKELRSSRLFLRLLEAVLKTGNRMNIGTIRGGARAFKLDALLKLADVKGTDGKTTLLHFVVQEMIKYEGMYTGTKNGEKTMKKTEAKTNKNIEEDYKARELELVPQLSSELGNVKKAASMDMDVLTSSVSNLSKGMSKLTLLVEEDLSSQGRDAGFVNSMRSFEKQANGVIRELKDSEDRVFRYVIEITEYYHGDGSKDEVNPLRIFVIVSDFLGMLDRVCKELKSSKCQHTLTSVMPFAKGS
ncbi:Formin-like protein 11 [Platanthera zijinensis]|uniref:Formin-like protein n=1 Tax=Platanthera zijinensis TaxID=2320716 RepID=A0AAP0B5Q3_9ASPA